MNISFRLLFKSIRGHLEAQRPQKPLLFFVFYFLLQPPKGKVLVLPPKHPNSTIINKQWLKTWRVQSASWRLDLRLSVFQQFLQLLSRHCCTRTSASCSRSSSHLLWTLLFLQELLRSLNGFPLSLVINYCSMSNTCLSLDSFLEPPVLSRSPPIQTLWCHQVLLVDETLFLWLFFTNNVLKLSGYFPVLSSFNSVKFGRKIQDNRDKKRGRNNHWMV